MIGDAQIDARIVLTLDYDPTLDCYPNHVKTKADAFRYDVQSVLDGTWTSWN